MSAGDVVLLAVGAAIVLVAVADMFVTIFNYDGFSFIANRLYGVLWKAMRTSARLLPQRARHTVLSLGSAAMLPATYALWLGLEVLGFALMFDAGLHAHAFSLKSVSSSIGNAFYLSAGAISSLTFGDIVPHTGLQRALVDLETIVGLTTFTLALGYVVTTFDVLRTLDGLHSIVRRHAEDPAKPSSILARHFRGGQPTELPSLLEAITEKLEDYDQGLRRYPVVYYFHTRRLARSIPSIFTDLGRLVALLRWGLPADESMTQDPLLAALITEYGTTLERLQRSFVGPEELDPPGPLPQDDFARTYAASAPAVSASGSVSGSAGSAGSAGSEPGERAADQMVAAFRELQHTARGATGIDAAVDPDDDDIYGQYREWLPFAYRNRVVLGRIADALGYEPASRSA